MTKKIIFLFFLAIHFFSLQSMEHKELVQVCANGVCKWVPVKDIISKTVSETEPSKSLFASTASFVLDHPKEFFYCVGSALGIVGLLCFMRSDYYWQTPGYERTLSNRRNKIKLETICYLEDLCKNSCAQIKQDIGNNVKALTNALIMIDKSVDTLEHDIAQHHKQTLLEESQQRGLLQQEQHNLFQQTTEIIAAELNQMEANLLDHLEQRRKTTQKALDNLKQEQKHCESTLLSDIRALGKNRKACQEVVTSAHYFIKDDEDRLLHQIVQKQNQTAQLVNDAHSQVTVLRTSLDLDDIPSKPQSPEMPMALPWHPFDSYKEKN